MKVHNAKLIMFQMISLKTLRWFVKAHSQEIMFHSWCLFNAHSHRDVSQYFKNNWLKTPLPHTPVSTRGFRAHLR